MKSDVEAMALQVRPQSLGPRVGKFRRSLRGLTIDSADAPLGLCTVHCFRTVDDIEVGQTDSDVDGVYEIALYQDGPFYCKSQKPRFAGQKRLYFHTEDTLQGAPAAPTGCRTLSELEPDLDDADAASIAGGHTSSNSGSAASVLNKPTAKDTTEVAGLPPVVATPAAAHQFGWFSDVLYTGTFANGGWTFAWREDDDREEVTGRAVINVFASTTRDFGGTMRLLAQMDPAGQDWWFGGLAIGLWTSSSVGPFVLNNEYLFVQVWCHETQLDSGRTFTFHQEGSDLADAFRSSLLTSVFLSSEGGAQVAGATANDLSLETGALT